MLEVSAERASKRSVYPLRRVSCFQVAREGGLRTRGGDEEARFRGAGAERLGPGHACGRRGAGAVTEDNVLGVRLDQHACR